MLRSVFEKNPIYPLEDNYSVGSCSMVSVQVSICKYVHSFHFLLIGMKKMEYKTRQWHEKCFVCCTCHNPIGTKSFIPKEHDIYCAKCYEDKFATKCIKCSKVIFKILLKYGILKKSFDYGRM